MLKELRNRMKFIKTLNLYLCFFVLVFVLSALGLIASYLFPFKGLSVSLTGPCLLDLQRLVRTDAQHIAMIYTARSGGYLLGAIVGIVLDLIRPKLAVLMTCDFFVAITMFVIPWSKNLEILMTFMCINGFALGAIITGGNVMCLELWGKDSKAVIQVLHFAFSLGGLLSPLIAAPFLQNKSDLSSYKNNSTYNSSILSENLVDTTGNISRFPANFSHFSEGAPKLTYPFSIVAAITLLATIFHLGVFLLSPTDDKSFKDKSTKEDSKISFVFMFFLVIFTFLIFFVAAGTETGYAQTITIFSVKGKLHLTATQGSYLTSAYWVALTVTRLLCVFIAMKISCLKLLIADICLISLSATGLLFLMPNEWTLWLSSLILGIGIASAYGVVVAWINTHMHISSKFSSVFPVGGATGEIVVPFIITYFIDTDPDMFCYIPAASAILMTILTSLLFCMFKFGYSIEKSKNLALVDVTETKY